MYGDKMATTHWNTLKVARCAILLLLSLATASAQLNRFKVPRQRIGSSKFSLNPLKPLMNLVRGDPLRASAQRQYPKYLPPPPGMFQPIAAPARVSYTAVPPPPPYRSYYSSRNYIPQSSALSLGPPLSPSPSSLVLSALVNDRYYGRQSSLGLPSDVHIKAVRIPTSRARRPYSSGTSSSGNNLSIADSVVRQLLDMQPQDNQAYPSVLVIEDPDLTAATNPSSPSSSSGVVSGDLFSDTMTSPQKAQPTILLAPPVHADFADSSSDLSASGGGNGNPEVFVIVSKNSKSGKGGSASQYYSSAAIGEDKKQDTLSTAGSSKTMKKYKITTGLEDFGGSGGSRQVWIIKR